MITSTYQQTENNMFSFKFLAYFLKPKFVAFMLFLDVTGIIHFIQKYIFADLTYLKWLAVVMFADLVSGVTKVWKNEGLKSVTSKGLRDTVSKVISYGLFLVVIHVLTHYQIGGESNTSFLWINKVAYEFLILIELKSIYENVILINPKLDFIQFMIDKIQLLLKSKK